MLLLHPKDYLLPHLLKLCQFIHFCHQRDHPPHRINVAESQYSPAIKISLLGDRDRTGGGLYGGMGGMLYWSWGVPWTDCEPALWALIRELSFRGNPPVSFLFITILFIIIVLIKMLKYCHHCHENCYHHHFKSKWKIHLFTDIESNQLKSWCWQKKLLIKVSQINTG